MGKGWTRWIVIQALLLIFLHLGSTNDCWESCFAPENRPSGLKDEYREILNLVERTRAVSATNGGVGESGATNGTIFVIDTSAPTGASDSQQSLVLDLQRKLAQVLAFSLPATQSYNPLFLVKFDGSRSWYCDEWTSLGRCDAYTKLETEYDQFSTVDASAEVSGNILDLLDDACYSADDAVTNNAFTFNELVVAFVNSPFQTAASSGAECPELDNVEKNTIRELDGLGGYQDFIEDENAGFGNWCERKFTKRVAVGTLFADEDELEHFASVSQGSWPGSSFMRENNDLLTAASNLAQCMNDECCPSSRRRRQASGDTCVEFKNNNVNNFSAS